MADRLEQGETTPAPAPTRGRPILAYGVVYLEHQAGRGPGTLLPGRQGRHQPEHLLHEGDRIP